MSPNNNERGLGQYIDYNRSAFESITADRKIGKSYYLYGGHGCGKTNFLNRIIDSLSKLPEYSENPHFCKRFDGKNYFNLVKFLNDFYNNGSPKSELVTNTDLLVIDNFDTFIITHIEKVLSSESTSTDSFNINSCVNALLELIRILKREHKLCIITGYYRTEYIKEKIIEFSINSTDIDAISAYLINEQTIRELVPYSKREAFADLDILESYHKLEIWEKHDKDDNTSFWNSYFWLETIQELTHFHPTLFGAIYTFLYEIKKAEKEHKSKRSISILLNATSPKDLTDPQLNIKRFLKEHVFNDSNLAYHFNQSFRRMETTSDHYFLNDALTYLYTFTDTPPMLTTSTQATEDRKILQIKQFLIKEGLVRQHKNTITILGEILKEFILDYYHLKSKTTKKSIPTIRLNPQDGNQNAPKGDLLIRTKNNVIARIPIKKYSWIIAKLIIGLQNENIGKIISVETIFNAFKNEGSITLDQSKMRDTVISAVRRFKTAITSSENENIDANIVIINVRNQGYKCPASDN